MTDNKLVIASAGSGKTTFLVKKALSIDSKKVLITTYTEANEASIINKIYKDNKYIPKNLVIQTWFSFLIQHGVKPYQGVVYEDKISGMLLTNKKSGYRFSNSSGKPVYFKEETHFKGHYLSKSSKVYSDKLAKLVCKVNSESNGMMIKRLEKLFDYILIDEVQDLAGNDLELIKLFLKSNIKVLMVGDPRQVTYLTHLEAKNRKYRDGNIKEFLLNECKRESIIIDEESLLYSFRCNEVICSFASRLYPQYTIPKSKNEEITGHDGVFLIKKEDVKSYILKYEPLQLRYSSKTKILVDYPSMNFGISKGLDFDRVIIYPTTKMLSWLKNNEEVLDNTTRAKFYVALTRARYSVGIICDDEISDEALEIFSFNKNPND